MRSNCPTVRYYVALNVCAEIERRVKKKKIVYYVYHVSRVPFFHV